ncbi:MAG: hypothetical protein QM730_24590 [Anaerolineales bacterium]
MKWLSTLIDKASEYFAHRKGLLPTLGILLILVNFVLPFFMDSNFITASNLFLHLGVIVAIFGFMLASIL